MHSFCLAWFFDRELKYSHMKYNMWTFWQLMSWNIKDSPQQNAEFDDL